MTLVGHSYAWKSHPTLCQKYSNMPALHTKDIIFAVKKVGRVFNNFVWKLFDLECNIYDHLQSVVTFSIFNIPMPGCRPFALIHNATFAEYQVYLQRVYFSSITNMCLLIYLCENTTITPVTRSLSSLKFSSLFWAIYYFI